MNEQVVAPPPEDPDAERALLGAVLLSGPDAFVVARALVAADDFTRAEHSATFSAIERLQARGESIDTTSVASEMPAIEGREKPLGFLIGLISEVPSLSVETHARRVRFCATRRRMAAGANDLAGVAYGNWIQTEADAMSRAQKIFDGLFSGQVGSSVILTPMVLAKNFNDTLLARERHDPEVIGFETGYADLDRYIAYRAGELWYVSASPGVGKTSFLANLQDELGRRDIPSLFASVEQPAIQLMDRAIASESRVDSWRIARGRLDERDWANVHNALDRRSKMPIYMYDDPSMTTSRLASVIQLAKVRHDIKVVFVDYVQLMADESAESEYARISGISRRLAHMARSLGICLVAACQVSRQGAQTDGQIPRLSDLRGSGGLEQDAFVVLSLGRKEGETTTQVAVRKNRNGMSGITVELVFDPAHTRFYSVARAA